jgi:hypothetical protein
MREEYSLSLPAISKGMSSAFTPISPSRMAQQCNWVWTPFEKNQRKLPHWPIYHIKLQRILKKFNRAEKLFIPVGR